MDCCQASPSHYLNQFWLLIINFLWHPHESNFMASTQATILYNEFENCIFRISTTSPRGKWVNWIKPVWHISNWNPITFITQRSFCVYAQLMRDDLTFCAFCAFAQPMETFTSPLAGQMHRMTPDYCNYIKEWYHQTLNYIYQTYTAWKGLWSDWGNELNSLTTNNDMMSKQDSLVYVELSFIYPNILPFNYVTVKPQVQYMYWDQLSFKLTSILWTDIN